jgi:translation initiation factor 2B subunit (eIF-2B alpha/beta/delta family)
LKAEINRVGTDESIREESEVSVGTQECAVYAKLTDRCVHPEL